MPQNCLEGFSWGCWLELWRDTLLAEVLFLLEALPSLLSPVTTLPPVPTALWASTCLLLVLSHTRCACYSHAMETGRFTYLESCKTQGRSCDSSVEYVIYLKNKSMNSI